MTRSPIGTTSVKITSFNLIDLYLCSLFRSFPKRVSHLFFFIVLSPCIFGLPLQILGVLFSCHHDHPLCWPHLFGDPTIWSTILFVIIWIIYVLSSLGRLFVSCTGLFFFQILPCLMGQIPERISNPFRFHYLSLSLQCCHYLLPSNCWSLMLGRYFLLLALSNLILTLCFSPRHQCSYWRFFVLLI